MTQSSDAISLLHYVRANSRYSRRTVLSAIIDGRVTVNQRVIMDAHTLVYPTDTVAINREPIRLAGQSYYKFHKPVGVISTLNDPKGRSDLSAYLTKHRLQGANVKPMGRLDRTSSGLLLFSNDGDVIQRVLHPKFSILKEYQIVLNKPLREDHKTKLVAGFFLSDGPVRLTITGSDDNAYHWSVSIGMGRNRILRRMFDYFGYDIVQLHRTRIGSIELGSLRAGQFLSIPSHDIKRLVEASRN